MTLFQQILAALNWNLRVNENFDSVSPAGLYGRNPATSTGLTWGYLGGNFNTVTVANGTVALTASNTNYIVAHRTTGAVTAATNTTNWLNTTTYMQLYSVVAGASTVTSYDDFRQAFGASAASTFAGGTLSAALNEAPPVTLASAATVNIGAAAANSVTITGTTTITAFDNIAAGAKRMLTFSGILTLTHNATSFILPSATNITTAAGDVAEFLSLGSGNWRCVAYTRASGAAITGSPFSGGTLSSALNEAPQVTLASASTVNIGAAGANSISISGTTTITAFDSIASGAVRRLVFQGALTFTHNATTLILPGGASITTAAGDVAWMESLGSGNWRCVGYQKANGQAVIGGGGGLTYITETLNTASPNNTINTVSLAVTGGTTNADLVLLPKGTGALLWTIPDSGTTGGNKRGNNAVDLQKARGAATNVASGANSVIGGGSSNTASGGNSVVPGGDSNQATNSYSFAMGIANVSSGIGAASFGSSSTASGSYSFAQGQSVTAGGSHSIATGSSSSTRTLIGMRSHSAGQSVGAGTCQVFDMHLRTVTASTSATSLTADNAAKSSTNHYVLPNRCTTAFHGLVTARNQTGDVAAWSFTGAITREANAASTVLLASVTPTSLGTVGAGSTMTLTVTADTANGSLDIQVAGVSAMHVSCLLKAAEQTRA